jgi:Uncharacterized protein conserved in bacteria (DUF2188)
MAKGGKGPDIHVVREAPHTWAVKPEGERATSTHRTQEAAIDAGRPAGATRASSSSTEPTEPFGIATATATIRAALRADSAVRPAGDAGFEDEPRVRV